LQTSAKRLQNVARDMCTKRAMVRVVQGLPGESPMALTRAENSVRRTSKASPGAALLRCAACRTA
jgi:hypothetical protein